MNVRMTTTHEIALPDEVVDALGLTPGSEVAFERGPKGEVLLVKAADAPKATLEEIGRRIESVRGTARPGLTTDAFMQLTRGDE